jgi:hypothetical protein
MPLVAADAYRDVNFRMKIRRLNRCRQMNVDRRMERIERWELRDNPIHRERWKNADRQDTILFVVHQPARCALHNIESFAHRRVIRMALWGQLERARQSAKQRETEIAFEKFDVATDCPLRHVQFGACRSEAQMPGSGFERAKGNGRRQSASHDDLSWQKEQSLAIASNF